MASQGKHVKTTQQMRVGKHGVAEQSRLDGAVEAVRSTGVSIWHAVVALAIVVVFCIVPVLVMRGAGDELDVQAFADPERTAFQSLSDPEGSADERTFPVERVPYAANVTEKLQNAIMSGGCEVVALSIALDSMGIGVDLHEFASQYLLIDGHFATGYSGDPYSKGGGYPPGIVSAANRYLAAVDADVRAHNITGSSMQDIRELVNLGYPVLCWTTMGFEDPEFAGAFDDGKEWYSNEHCVVVYGFERRAVLASDPLEGMVVRDLDRFEEIYVACGSMAIAVF